MATLDSPLELNGSIGNITFYKRKDLDKIIARRKGGASRKKVLYAPGMEGTRRVNAEFGGRATATKWLLAALRPLKPVSDFNWAPSLNKLLRPIQLMDTESPLGKRSVCLSKAPWLPEGFQLNRRQRFEDILPNPVHLTLSATGNVMTLAVPALLPGTNFFAPAGKYDWYRLVLTCAVIPDFFHTPHGYRPVEDIRLPIPDQCGTGWQPVREMAAPQLLELPFSSSTLNGVLVTSIGIIFGKAGANGEIEPVKHAGAGKILSVTNWQQAGTKEQQPSGPDLPAGDGDGGTTIVNRESSVDNRQSSVVNGGTRVVKNMPSPPDLSAGDGEGVTTVGNRQTSVVNRQTIAVPDPLFGGPAEGQNE